MSLIRASQAYQHSRTYKAKKLVEQEQSFEKDLEDKILWAVKQGHTSINMIVPEGLFVDKIMEKLRFLGYATEIMLSADEGYILKIKWGKKNE